MSSSPFPRSSTHPVFDRLQYVKLGLHHVICDTADYTNSRCNSLFTFCFSYREAVELKQVPKKRSNL